MPPLESEFFPASYDATTKVLSGILCAVLAAVIASSQSAVVAVIGLLIMGLGYAYSPRGYAILDRSIAVRRLIGSVSISLDGIREARAAAKDDFTGCIRLWGSGGLFGYYGLFRTSKLGKSTWYVTNRDHAVVIVTDAKTVVLSPDEVDRFLAALRAAFPVPVAQPAPAFDSQSSWSWPAALAILGGVVAAGAVAFALLYSPGPPSYTLTPESLTIHDRFYPVTIAAASVAVEQIRVADISAESEWRPVTRTNGFASAHYRSGWFRAGKGQKLRMYRAAATRLVLLPPKGNTAPVLLEVKDPDAFVATLQQAWLSSGRWSH